MLPYRFPSTIGALHYAAVLQCSPPSEHCIIPRHAQTSIRTCAAHGPTHAQGLTQQASRSRETSSQATRAGHTRLSPPLWASVPDAARRVILHQAPWPPHPTFDLAAPSDLRLGRPIRPSTLAHPRLLLNLYNRPSPLHERADGSACPGSLSGNSSLDHQGSAKFRYHPSNGIPFSIVLAP
jgi:hypothetical protein